MRIPMHMHVLLPCPVLQAAQLSSATCVLTSALVLHMQMGGNALHVACAAGQQPAAEALINMGADVAARDAEGRTPLWHAWAAPSGPHHGVAGMLLRLGRQQAGRADGGGGDDVPVSDGGGI